MNNTVNWAGETTINYAPLGGETTVKFNAPQTFNILNLKGHLGGSGDILVTNVLNWISEELGSEMLPTGRTIIGPRAQLNFIGSGGKHLNRVLENHGTTYFNGSNPLFIGDWVGEFRNLPGAVFNASGEGDLVRCCGGFYNYGTFNKRKRLGVDASHCQ